MFYTVHLDQVKSEKSGKITETIHTNSNIDTHEVFKKSKEISIFKSRQPSKCLLLFDFI